MTTIQREIVSKLIAGHYLVKTQNHNGFVRFKLYSLDGSPVRYCSAGIVASLDRLLTFKGQRRPNARVPKSIFKKDKDGRVTLNLSNVRRLHGAHWILKEYKKQKLTK